ncbi:MAG: helix-turn-helix transcriptional regulator [Desulfovibrionaceae bacterium]|nr:helix-turn-helix transcriptional regulator [Desulfovibrionaceae bacterium]MBF0513487.1 helix-turn-helix transcriptional regulator [Desulfovibrionaceae bacterium]
MDSKQAAKVLKALSHPNRLEIYLSIAKGEQERFAVKELHAKECCVVSALIENLKIGAPTVSHHLKELVNAGLIVTERQGKFLIARAVPETWTEVNTLLLG